MNSFGSVRCSVHPQWKSCVQMHRISGVSSHIWSNGNGSRAHDRCQKSSVTMNSEGRLMLAIEYSDTRLSKKLVLPSIEILSMNGNGFLDPYILGIPT